MSQIYRSGSSKVECPLSHSDSTRRAVAASCCMLLTCGRGGPPSALGYSRYGASADRSGGGIMHDSHALPPSTFSTLDSLSLDPAPRPFSFAFGYSRFGVRRGTAVGCGTLSCGIMGRKSGARSKRSQKEVGILIGARSRASRIMGRERGARSRERGRESIYICIFVRICKKNTGISLLEYRNKLIINKIFKYFLSGIFRA